MRVKFDKLPDYISPDRGCCEHCGNSISWDDICYTHDHSGFAECATVISGGVDIGSGMKADVQLGTDSSKGDHRAEPTTWYYDA